MIELQICVVNLLHGSKIQIFVKKIGTYRKRIISFNPNKSQLETLMTIFGVKNPKKMEGKTFQIPKKLSQTNLAFEHIIKQGQL